MFRRRRPLLRAAVVGGGAYVAGKHVANRQADQAAMEADQDARISDLEQQQAPASSPMIDQLNQLADLHQQGVLTDEEFASAKAKLFSGDDQVDAVCDEPQPDDQAPRNDHLVGAGVDPGPESGQKRPALARPDNGVDLHGQVGR